jgi:hypothetical protein
MRPALLALLVALPASALAAPPAPAPAPVRADLAALHAECRSYGGRPGASPNLLKSADLNGDGLAEYVIDQGGYNCDGAASAMGAGQSGAAVRVYAGLAGGGAKLAWQNTAYGTSIVSAGGRARLWIDTAGFECGQRGANIPFSDIKACSRPLNWSPAKSAFIYAPLSEAKQVQ